MIEHKSALVSTMSGQIENQGTIYNELNEERDRILSGEISRLEQQLKLMESERDRLDLVYSQKRKESIEKKDKAKKRKKEEEGKLFSLEEEANEKRDMIQNPKTGPLKKIKHKEELKELEDQIKDLKETIRELEEEISEAGKITMPVEYGSYEKPIEDIQDDIRTLRAAQKGKLYTTFGRIEGKEEYSELIDQVTKIDDKCEQVYYGELFPLRMVLDQLKEISGIEEKFVSGTERLTENDLDLIEYYYMFNEPEDSPTRVEVDKKTGHIDWMLKGNGRLLRHSKKVQTYILLDPESLRTLPIETYNRFDYTDGKYESFGKRFEVALSEKMYEECADKSIYRTYESWKTVMMQIKKEKDLELEAYRKARVTCCSDLMGIKEPDEKQKSRMIYDTPAKDISEKGGGSYVKGEGPESERERAIKLLHEWKKGVRTLSGEYLKKLNPQELSESENGAQPGNE